MSEERFCVNCGRSSHKVNVTCKQMCLTCYGYRNDPEKLKRVREKFNQDATIDRLEAEKAQKQLVIDDCRRNLKEQDAAIARLTQELANRCETCGAKVSSYPSGCPTCGAPQCCQWCCKREALKAENASLREEASLYQKEWAKLRAALDEAKDGLTAAHMHGFEEGRDQYRDKVRKLQDALDAERGRIYPCADCGKMRTKEEGGTTFTVCDECWDKRFDKKGNK